MKWKKIPTRFSTDSQKCKLRWSSMSSNFFEPPVRPEICLVNRSFPLYHAIKSSFFSRMQQVAPIINSVQRRKISRATIAPPLTMMVISINAKVRRPSIERERRDPAGVWRLGEGATLHDVRQISRFFWRLSKETIQLFISSCLFFLWHCKIIKRVRKYPALGSITTDDNSDKTEQESIFLNWNIILSGKVTKREEGMEWRREIRTIFQVHF